VANIPQITSEVRASYSWPNALGIRNKATEEAYVKTDSDFKPSQAPL